MNAPEIERFPRDEDDNHYVLYQRPDGWIRCTFRAWGVAITMPPDVAREFFADGYAMSQRNSRLLMWWRRKTRRHT